MTPYRLTICGIDELDEHADAGVSHAISILDPDEPVPERIQQFSGLHDHWVLRFHDVSHSLPGTRPPEPEDIDDLLALGARAADAGARHVLVHCHAGVSRSTAAAAILMAEAAPGREREVLDVLQELRPIASPNVRMMQLADFALARQGALTQALDAWMADRLGAKRGSLISTLFGR